MSKTLDMKGRTEAVALMQNMAAGFANVNVPDPNKLQPFIESITGSVMAIIEVTELHMFNQKSNRYLSKLLLLYLLIHEK